MTTAQEQQRKIGAGDNSSDGSSTPGDATQQGGNQMAQGDTAIPENGSSGGGGGGGNQTQPGGPVVSVTTQSSGLPGWLKWSLIVIAVTGVGYLGWSMWKRHQQGENVFLLATEPAREKTKKRKPKKK